MFQQLWSPDMIQNVIFSVKGKEPLNSHYFAVHYPDVYAAACRLFGCWGEAIESCGIDYDTVRKYKVWDRTRVVERIRQLHKKKACISSSYIQDHQKSLYMAAIHHFRSWSKAIQAAGLDYKSVRCRRSMTPAEVKKEIRYLYKKGVDLAYPNMRKNYQYLLASGSKKLGHGSWAAARRVCGVKDNFRSQHRQKNKSELHLLERL